MKILKAGRENVSKGTEGRIGVSVRMAEKRKTLAGSIVSIIVILVIAGLIMVIAGLSMLYSYQKQMSGLQYRVAEENMLKINQEFMILGMDLRNLLYNGEAVRKVSEAYEEVKNGNSEEEDRAVMNRSNRVRELKNTFLNMERIHGTCYNFFYYDREYGAMIEYGLSDYTVRTAFMQNFKKKYDDGSLRYTRNSKWFFMDGYLCTIYKSSTGIIGAWAVAEEFAEAIFELAPERCCGIEFYIPGSREAVRFEKDEKGIITGTQVQVSDETYYEMGNADFKCRFILDTSVYENMIVYPLLFLVMIIIYLIFVSSILLYTKRNILSQVRFFYDNLLRFRDTAKFNGNAEIIEFAEAGKVLNELSEEINKLKIGIYEEQLARQRTELDYVQLQIRPHFYLNCLNIVYSMAQVGRTKEIQQIALHVSKYLRYIFKRSMDPVPIGKELEFTANYLKVVECMYAEYYPCHMEVQESLEDFLIPPLLIQTFVENSLKHNQGNGKPFHVEIGIDELHRPAEKICRIRIMDNGTGFREEIMDEMNRGVFHEGNSEYHIGLKNAVARMELLYGNRAKIRFSNRPEGGAEVLIDIPMEGYAERA